MTNNEVYNNPDRKRELVLSLKAILDAQIEAAEILDKKALDLLSVTSAIFGVVAAIEITKGDSTKPAFLVVLAGVLIIYLFLVREVLIVVNPTRWTIVPGGVDGKMSYESLLMKYVQPDENTFFDKLIVDYVGKESRESNKPAENGAIQVAQENNNQKVTHLQRAAQLLCVIIIGLIIMAAVGALSSNDNPSKDDPIIPILHSDNLNVDNYHNYF